MSYSLSSPVDPWKYFSHTKLRILARLLTRPNVSELRSESSSARSASKLVTADSTALPQRSVKRSPQPLLVRGVYLNSAARFAAKSPSAYRRSPIGGRERDGLMSFAIRAEILRRIRVSS